MPWLIDWDGFAQSLLPTWTAPGETVRAPHSQTFGEHEGVSFALEGTLRLEDYELVYDFWQPEPYRAEIAYVPMGEWLIAVVAVGPPAEVDALRSHVAAIAASLNAP